MNTFSKIEVGATNGRMALCPCGRHYIAKGEAKLKVWANGNTPIYFCGDCLDGKVATTEYRNYCKDSAKQNAKTTLNHDIKVVCTNPITALYLATCFRATLEEREDGILVSLDNQTSCQKGGHLFTNNELDNEFHMMFVNGEPVRTLDEYHRVVKLV